MKRRAFLSSAAAAAGAGALSQACSKAIQPARHEGPGFDVHPFVKSHPEAVFIQVTDIESKTDAAAMKNAGAELARELIVRVPSNGYRDTTKITVKPNWTCAGPRDDKFVVDKLGVNTDPYFVEGWVGAMRNAGPQEYFIRECACPGQWGPMGYSAMCERAGIDLRDLSSPQIWELKKDRDLTYVKIPNGVVFKEVAYMAPMNQADTFLVNIAKFKAHGMGITTNIKNLQGIAANRFHQFCTRYNSISRQYEEYYQQFFQDDLEQHIEELYKKHLDEGYPRWDRPGDDGGIWQETWANRMLDSLSVTPTGINIIEGIYSQDGNGFGSGPHEKIGEYGITSRDYMSNQIMFGMDPFRTDIIAHWLGGHEPGNFGLFHIGIERGMSSVLDPHDIPVYLWKDGKATLVDLDTFKRTPLVTYYLQRDYNGQKEERFHLCDEPFNYSAWKNGAKVADCTPSIRELGRDGRDNMVMELTLPRKDNVYVDVLNNRGEVVWRLVADDLEPGVHQVVWEGFSSPGLYNVYAKGMGWDAARQIVTYS